MTGIVNSTGARSGVIGTTVGTPSGGLDGVTTGSGNVTITDGDLILGTSGKGIDFSATSDAGGMTSEMLDDYEEGTFTPGFSSSGASFSFSSQVGKYTKIGNVVHCQIFINYSSPPSSTLTNSTSLTGLPFTSSSMTNLTQSATVGRIDYANWEAGQDQSTNFYVSPGDTNITLKWSRDDGADEPVLALDIDNSSFRLALAITYLV